MKTKLLFLSILFFTTTLVAQKNSLLIAGPGDGGIILPSNYGTVYFNFDNAGNQIKRSFIGNKTSNEKTVTTVSKEDDIKEVKSELDYYPNPIKDELAITWAKSKNTYINAIEVFDVSGKLIKSFNPSKNNQELHLPFQDIASGVYIIKALFNNGKQDSFKVIKE